MNVTENDRLPLSVARHYNRLFTPMHIKRLPQSGLWSLSMARWFRHRNFRRQFDGRMLPVATVGNMRRTWFLPSSTTPAGCRA